MAEYLDEVSTIITALDTVNEIIPEKDLVMCVVRGLPSAYSSIKQAVRISPTPVDLATLSSWIKSEEDGRIARERRGRGRRFWPCF